MFLYAIRFLLLTNDQQAPKRVAVPFCRSAVVVDAVAIPVDCHDERHAAERDAAHSFRAQVGKSDVFHGGDAGGDQRACAADGGKIHRPVAHDGVSDFAGYGAFPDDKLDAAVVKQRRVRVHTRRRGGAAGVDDAARHVGARAGVVDAAAIELKGERLSLLEHVHNAGVRSVPRGVDVAGEQDALAGFQRVDHVLRHRGVEFNHTISFTA